MKQSNNCKAQPWRLCRSRSTRHALRLAMLLMLSAAMPAPGAAAATDPQFCAEAQREVSGVTIPVRNVVHRDFDAFVKSKPGIQPLETQQYSEPAATPDGISRRISCKMKTADHIRAVHGNSSAIAPLNPNACRELNRRIILSEWSRLTASQRARAVIPPNRFLLQADENRIMGSGWIEPYAHVYADGDGNVYVLAKALLVEWDDWLWKLAPDRFRGTHYCHLITPEYTRALMLGAVQAPPLSRAAVPAVN